MIVLKNKEKLLLPATCFLAGIVVGFLISPVKRGIFCGNYNGNQFREDNYKSSEDKTETQDGETNADFEAEL